MTLIRSSVTQGITVSSLLLLPNEGGGTLAHSCLIHGLACGSHGSDESLPLSVRATAAAAACCPSTVERLELLPGIVGKTVVVGGGKPLG
jgi:hypothetical protein